MPAVGRDYSEPDVKSSLKSVETSNPPGHERTPTTYSEISRRRVGYYRGENVPGYNSLRRAGGLVPMTYYTRFDAITTASGWREWDRKPVGTYPNQYQTFSKVANFSLMEITRLEVFDTTCLAYLAKYEGYAKNMLQEAAADVSGAFDALTFVAELHELRGMFESVGLKMLRHLASKPLKGAANAYLQWQFGWRQLYNDLRAIRSKIAHTPTSGRCKKHRRTSFSTESATSWDVTYAYGDIVHYDQTETVEIGVVGTVIAQLSAIDQTLQANPVATAWEIVPYSFVVDYFFNIGAWIRAASFSLSASQHRAAAGFSVSVVRTIDASPSGTGTTGAYFTAFRCSAHGVSTAKLLIRTPRDVSLSVPKLTFNITSMTRVMNLVALAIQKLR